MDPKFKSIPSVGPCKPEKKRVKTFFFKQEITQKQFHNMPML